MKKSLSVIVYAVILLVTISSCKKNDPAPSNPNGSNSVIGTFYFKGTFGNAAYNQASTASANAFNNGIGSSSTGNYVDYANSDAYEYEFWEGSYWSKVDFQSSQYNEIDALVMRVHKTFSYIGEDYPSEQDIKNIYGVGTYTGFSTLSNTNSSYPTTQGWDIEVTDANGKVWASYKGTADQTGSYVKIDSQKEVYMTGTKFLSAKGSMSCNLYDDSGNVKILKGSFNQLFSDYTVDY